MKLLIVGDGRHDIGKKEYGKLLRKARGTLASLCKKMCPSLSEDSLSLRWNEIPAVVVKSKNFGKSTSYKGYEAALARAIKLGAAQGCCGTVAVVDNDNDEKRAMLISSELNQNPSPQHPVAVGIAYQSIEAWALGDQAGVASAIGIEVRHVAKAYKNSETEDLYTSSGKIEKDPKRLLKELAKRNHKPDCADLREQIISQSDLDTIKRNCPKGFAPFADDFMKKFSSGD